jgi:hypothetical protein
VAVAITRLALGWWAWRASGAGRTWPTAAGRHVTVADALLSEDAWPEADPTRPGIVVGNPPFLGQLARRTARSEPVARALVDRYGPAAKGYVDSAALFLLAACRHRPAGCRVGLILPETVLVAAHAAALRRAVLGHGRLTDLWLGGPDVFAAGVRVCAPVLDLGHRDGCGLDADGGGAGHSRTVGRRTRLRTWAGPGVEAAGCSDISHGELTGEASASWGPLAAPLRDVPRVRPRVAGRIADLADTTAGFRDQFYGLVPFVDEADQLPPELSSPAPGGAPTAALVTAGAIDPAHCWWGGRPSRFAGRRLLRPVVDLASLTAIDPVLAQWVRGRLRSKVVVATQGKVVEATADPHGRMVPSVPVVSVEPRDPDDVWRLLAVLLSPVTTAWALEHYGGAGLAASAVKLSARQVATVSLPADVDAWDEAASHCRSATTSQDPQARRTHLRAAGRLSCAAYGVAAATGTDLVLWWEQRAPGGLPHV